jgi:DUF2075 family protein
MIVYVNTVGNFVDECNKGIIADLVLKGIRSKHMGGGADSEFNSWKNSLPTLADKIFSDKEIDRNLDVAIEYRLVTSDKKTNRVDFIIYGQDENGKDTLISIELKQWSEAKRSNLANYVLVNSHGDIIEDRWHPSIQAYNYNSILKAFNEFVYDNGVQLESCSYCHNMPQVYSFLLKDDKLYPIIHSSPIFLQGDEAKLVAFIKKYVKTPHKKLLYEIDDSIIRPSKEFSETFLSAMAGNQMLTCDSEQSFSISKVVAEVNQAIKDGVRRTIIIKGGPGTGKSVVAVNILGQLLHPSDNTPRRNACYVTPNYTPREVFSNIMVAGDYKKAVIKNVFKTLTSFVGSSEFDYDCVILDEAHRAFSWKFGMGVKRDVDAIDRLFYASRVNVFFIDEDQIITQDDYLTEDVIKKYAQKYGSTVMEGDRLTLKSQFRCAGGENYISFINSFLGYDQLETPLEKSQYDFRVFDNPCEMRDALYAKQKEGGTSRIVSGYTHEWISKGEDHNDIEHYDIVYPEYGFKMKWNLCNKLAFVEDKTQFDRVGCVHTVQGVDLDYCAVIIGQDLRYENGQLVFDKSKNAKGDQSRIRSAPTPKAERMIRNSYKVLLTRGIRGTYVYCEDKGLSRYLKSFLKNR